MSDPTPVFKSALDFAAGQARRILTKYPGYVPMYTVGGRWDHEKDRWTNWAEGFFPGVLWLLYKYTKDNEWLAPARELSHRLEPRQHDRAVHDLGFLFLSTYLREYRLTGDVKLRDILITAGRTLAQRRQKGGYLCSFLGPQSLFIDIMMNVGLLLWAARHAGDSMMFQMALEHSRTTARYIVRADGSTAHEGIFSPSGIFMRQSTQQGWGPESTWSRGLAWAIYGFTAVHRLAAGTAGDEFLVTARRCAEYFLKKTQAPYVPWWDYDLPEKAPRLWDSSAAAITASGLLDLSEEVSDAAVKTRYRNAALAILKSLCSDNFLPRKKPKWEGILMNGVYHFPKKLGVDELNAWGDHFFVEALVKAVAGKSDAGW